MYPEDRVLVGVMPDPRDFEIAESQHWYRIPAQNLSKGIHAEYVAFYFTKRFGPELRWAIHYYARRTGHELVKRAELLPDEAHHPRSDDLYYKLQLGPLKQRVPPIASTSWRRITFIHTTWDRFVAAKTVSDLYSTDRAFVDRAYQTLKKHGYHPQRNVRIADGGTIYPVDIVINCHDGPVMLSSDIHRPDAAIALTESLTMDSVKEAVEQRGGVLKKSESDNLS